MESGFCGAGFLCEGDLKVCLCSSFFTGTDEIVPARGTEAVRAGSMYPTAYESGVTTRQNFL